MMVRWKGIMTSGFLEMPVTVTYGSPSASLREWSGSGATDKYWPMSPLQFETNIGTVLILKQAIRADGKHHIEFKGSGNPKGPLAEAVG
jgi:hypothetical protein